MRSHHCFLTIEEVNARATPVSLSRNGIPGLALHTLDQYPKDGLGIYDDLESSSHFSGYVWSDWTTKREMCNSGHRSPWQKWGEIQKNK